MSQVIYKGELIGTKIMHTKLIKLIELPNYQLTKLSMN